jgi:extracellular factor (EF) 3-hydroxypalmitic acid methyl ester biosynthesis protein
MFQQLTNELLAQSEFKRPAPVSCEDAGLETLSATYDQFMAGRVSEGMRDLLPVLQARRLCSSDLAWAEFVEKCLAHPLRALLHQDPFTYRVFSKPRGYAGDAVMLDYVYGREEGWPAPPSASTLGKEIFQFTTGSSACEAVRARRGFIADLVDGLSEELRKPHVLSVACGHLREALLCSTIRRRRFSRYVALDSDLRSLEEVTRCYGSFGVQTCNAGVRQLLTRRLDLGLFDLVYSTGLYDYLQMPAAQRLTASLFDLLRPRGRLLIANFLPGILDRGYMESYMAWKLIFRTRQDMLMIAEEIRLPDIHDIRIFAEENQNIIFLQITKK